MAKIYTKKSRISGKGIFAVRDIKKGEFVGRIKGPMVPDNKESWDKYGEYYLHPVSYTEAILNKAITRFTNHSCNPNCGYKGNTKIVAMRDIKRGEEITVDYDAVNYKWRMKCSCGSKNCRKVIRGYKYLNKEIKRKYRGYITPYLLKRPCS